ncbi:Putative aconitate hydratase 2 [Verticillium dahliae VDG1]|nr:Putative aconitate hydratase 2 [Verticillium dahliae VDG1]
MNTIDMEVTPVDLAVTYEDMVQRLERAEKQIDLQRLQIAVLEAQQAPIAPEVPATVIHELFSKLTYEINILALILTGPVVVETAHPRLAKGLEMLGEQWKGWIVDEATRSSVFEAFVWYEVAQYFGSQHRDIWAGKMGGAFKDVCKQLRSSDELFAVLKTYLPAHDAANPDASVSHAATLHYRLLNIYTLAVRIDDVLLGSKNPMFLVYGRPKRFDAATMWPSVENVDVADETPVKFQISPSIKMKVQPEGGGAVASVFITKAKVCI